MIVGLLKYNLKQRDTTHEALEAGAQTLEAGAQSLEGGAQSLAASSPVPEASSSEPSLSAAASPGGLFTGPRNIWCHDPDHLNAPNQPALIVSSFNMKKKTSQSERCGCTSLKNMYFLSTYSPLIHKMGINICFLTPP